MEKTEVNPLEVQVGGNHYKKYKIQPAEFCEVNQIGFLESCVIKRMCRHQDKSGVMDLDKAIHEINLIKKIKYGVNQDNVQAGD